jgi:cell wall-associated NlpC family hydrolase
VLPPTTPGEFAPMSFEPSHPLAPLLGDPYILSLAQLKPKNAAATAPKPFVVTGLVSTAPRVLASRGGSPRDRMAQSRGGSPRDRMGSGMASQALSYRGMRYVRGGVSPTRGFDCSGLIYFLLRQRGYNPPRTAAGYRSWGQNVPKSQLVSGDLVLFANTYKRGISHIGVYLGSGKFVHAATSGTGVRVSSLNEAYYAGKYFGARRPK